MKKTLSRIFIAAVVAGAILAVYGCVSFKGNAVKEPAELFISKQLSYDELMEEIMPKIKHHAAFNFYAKRLNLSQTYKAGHYVLEDGMNVIQIVRMLKLGLQTPVNITINNVKIPAQMAGKLSKQIDADSVEILQVLKSKEVAQKVGFDSVTLFSMFLPDTYEVYWTISPEEFVERMKREYDSFWTNERDAKRKRAGLSRLEVMTLASIVYEETRKIDEMPRVAGVYINRLKKGMLLQADPTVKYAMQDFTLRRILHKHLKTDSPYNTYVYKGLPPSPICMPSRECIDASLNFEKHNYLYFCARPTFDGYHNFAATYDQHLRNARAYSAELNRRNIK